MIERGYGWSKVVVLTFFHAWRVGFSFSESWCYFSESVWSLRAKLCSIVSGNVIRVSLQEFDFSYIVF